ncbi:MAG: hypothetical protein J6U86_04440 [Clostridia bacterium]|nr:hypothetical protein [Clostridia bacterium]
MATTSGEKTRKITLPLLEGRNAVQEAFVCVNFKPYQIQRGVEVEIPESVYNVLMESERAKNEAILERQKKALRSPENSERVN